MHCSETNFIAICLTSKHNFLSLKIVKYYQASLNFTVSHCIIYCHFLQYVYNMVFFKGSRTGHFVKGLI